MASSVFIITQITKDGKIGDSYKVMTPNKVGENAVQSVRDEFGVCRVILQGFDVNGEFIPSTF